MTTSRSAESVTTAPVHPASGSALTIFTIGHGTRSIGEFIALLRSAQIERLLDVRTAPGSRRNPQFGQTELRAALGDVGIDYDHCKELGGFRKPRAASPHLAIRNKGFRGYADHMESDAFRRSLAWLIETSTASRTAIMCAEALWWRCHRRMIGDALTVAGVEVVHLLDEHRREPHRLHPNLRLSGDSLVYDAGVLPGVSVAESPTSD